MPKFSQISRQRLSTCHPDLQAVCNELIKQYDFSVLEGFRGRAAQETAYKRGSSQVTWPHSAHNKTPSLAVDIAPYPIDWDNIYRFNEMMIRFDTIANMLRADGIIRSDFIYSGKWSSLPDWPHVEINEN